MMLMLTLDDAVAVCMRFLHETTYFDDMPREEYESMLEFIRGEFEQKCWQPEVLACGEGELIAQPEHSGGLYVDGYNDGYKDGVKDAQPERKRGKWIFIRGEEAGNALYMCSACGKGDIHAPEVRVSYCWNCGAQMEEEA